jgi:hypothetical protein
VITAAICLMGALAWVLLVGSVEQVNWASKRDGVTAPVPAGA